MLIPQAMAQTATGSASSGGASILIQMLPLALIFVVFWFLLIRPQQQRQKAHVAKIGAVKKGDTVITGGGMVGRVTRTDDVYADVELAPGMKVKVVKAMISDVVDPATAKPAND